MISPQAFVFRFITAFLIERYPTGYRFQFAVYVTLQNVILDKRLFYISFISSTRPNVKIILNKTYVSFLLGQAQAHGLEFSV